MYKRMNALKKIWDWVVWSSANPDKISLTLKGIIAGAIVVLSIFGITNPLSEEETNSFILAFVQFLQTVVAIASSAAVLIGFVRKVWLTITGNNKAIW